MICESEYCIKEERGDLKLPQDGGVLRSSLKNSFEMQQPPSPVSFQQMPICKSPVPVLSLAGSGWFPDQECLGRRLFLSIVSQLPISLCSVQSWKTSGMACFISLGQVPTLCCNT